MALEDIPQHILDFFHQMEEVVRANMLEHGSINPTIMIQYVDEKGESAVHWQPFDPRDSRTMSQSIQLAKHFAEAKNSECILYFSDGEMLDIPDEERIEWESQGNDLRDHPKVVPVIAAQLELPGEYYIAISKMDGKDFEPMLLSEVDRSWISGEVVDLLPHNRGLKYIYGESSKNISH